MAVEQRSTERQVLTPGFALKVALVYAVLGGLWIHFSDEILMALVKDRQTILLLATGKGWFFVGVTALLLYFTVHRWQKRVEARDAALRESEDRYRSLVELAPDAIIIHVKGIIRYANPVAARTLRVASAEDLVGRPIMDLVHPDFRAAVAERVRRMTRDGERVPALAEKFVCPDGTVVEGEAAAAPLTYDGERAVQVVVRDVTRRRQEEERLRWLSRVVEQVGEGVCVFDNRQAVTFANRAWAQMHGYAPEEIVGQHHHLFHSEEQLLNQIPHIDDRLLEAGKVTGEVWHQRRDGTTFPTDMTVTLLTEDTGKVIGRIAFARDVTERKEAERLLRESEAKFRVLAENSLSSIMVFRGRRLIYANPATEQISGWTRDDLAGQGYWNMVHPAHRPELLRTAEDLLSGKATSFRSELRILRKDGDERWVDFSAGATEIDGAPAALATAFDITDRKSTEERLEHLAHYDFLTGLPNRLLFFDRLAGALSEASSSSTSLGLLFLDLDRFKDVNDTMGHDVGDLILQGVSRRLSRGASGGGLAARTGSDEFALLMPSAAGLEEVERTVREVLAELAMPFTVAAQEVHITASAGVSLFPADGSTAEDLMRAADLAMYRAKALGGNSFQFVTPGISAQATAQMALKNRLRRGLERQEFQLFYQPILDLASGRPVAMEALVRWQHPEHGTLPPGQFIPLAEETGLILPLGEWVLHAACVQNMAWQSAGFAPVRVSVNLSARQFQQRDLAENVALVLKSTGMEARYLELEITESTAMADMDNTVATLERLSALGVSLAIDDFGTGYSSLAYLKKFPIQQLKIDHSFVHDVPGDPDDSAIVTAVVAMARGLGLRVVAEGVENTQQLEFLRQLGCDAVQGYYFSRPAPAEAWTRKSLDW